MPPSPWASSARPSSRPSCSWPRSRWRAAEIARLAGVDRETVDERLGDLEVSLVERGIRLVLSGDRVELTTAPDAGALIARYVGADAVRLSPAALETLAIVAYRQPVTKAAIERIRGVDSDYTVRSLLHRRLVVEQGRTDAPGRPILYGTGFEFLERFGITEPRGPAGARPRCRRPTGGRAGCLRTCPGSASPRCSPPRGSRRVAERTSSSRLAG